MATYTIVPRQSQAGYKVDVVDSDGVRHSMLGFDTEAEAQAWVDADEEVERLANDAIPSKDASLR
jgi:hypothetical protein